MKKILGPFLLLMVMLLPLKISAMVLMAVEAPHIVGMGMVQDNEVEFELQYHEDMEYVLEHYKNVSNPLEIVAEVNINRSGWNRCQVINPEKLDTKKKFVWNSPLDFNDNLVELRVQIKDKIGDYLSSEWTDVYSANLEKLFNKEKSYGDIKEEVEEVPQDTPTDSLKDDIVQEEKVCLLGLTVCCKSIFNVSLCIWILLAIILIVMIIGVLFSKKHVKK